MNGYLGSFAMVRLSAQEPSMTSMSTSLNSLLAKKVPLIF